MKVIYKFATGENVPDGAVYLSTITEDRIVTETLKPDNPACSNDLPCTESRVYHRLVWHYFLVDQQ